MVLNDKKAELIGAIIGDGCIRYKPKISQYYVEIVGDPKQEKEYFKHLTEIFWNELKLKTHIKIRERGLRLKVYSKSFVEYLVYELKMPCNKEKCQNIFIPEEILQNKKLLKCCIRGIVDTDGSLFLANIGYRKDYPTIEISTTSKRLANQLHDKLSQDFRIGFRNYKQADYNRIYRISINGDRMVNRWHKEIGFSNKRIIDRYQKLKESGPTGI